MNCRIQVVVIAEDGSQETREIQSIERNDLKPETLGLTLAEGKAILKDIQQIVVQRQIASGLAPCRQCPDCGRWRRSKGYHNLSLRTVFGQLTVKSPRWHHCECASQEISTFSPLAELLPDHTTPELLFLETKWASLMSDGMTAKLLEDVLPIDHPLHGFTFAATFGMWPNAWSGNWVRNGIASSKDASETGTNFLLRMVRSPSASMAVMCAVNTSKDISR